MTHLQLLGIVRNSGEPFILLRSPSESAWNVLLLPGLRHRGATHVKSVLENLDRPLHAVGKSINGHCPDSLD